MTSDKGDDKNVNPWRILGWLADVVALGCVATLIHFNAEISDIGYRLAKVELNVQHLQENGVVLARIDLRLIEIEKNMAGMSASKFTAADGLEIWKQVADLKSRVAQMDSERRKTP